MRDLRILPVPGRLARHPETGEPVSPDGLTAPASAHWLRRLKDGDVALAPDSPSTERSLEHGDQL